MSKWTRDNGIFRADNPLCSGALIDMIRGNAEHILLECKTDITTPLNGTTLGSGVYVAGPATGIEWMAVFGKIRPFAVPVRYNTDGTFGEIKVTVKGYSNGSSTNKLRVYSSKFPPYGAITGQASQWLATSQTAGLIGAIYQNYGETGYTGSGEKTIEISVTPDIESIYSYEPDNGTGGFRDSGQRRTATITWLSLDAWISNVTYFRFRTMRVQDVLT